MIPIQRPPLLSEVVTSNETTVYATVNVPETIAEGEEYFIGKVLTTSDGGRTFDAMTEEVWVEGSHSDGDVVFHNGHIFESLADTNTAEPGTDPLKWRDDGVWNANGILIENIRSTGMAAVSVECLVMESHLRGFDISMRQALFNNKIITQ